MSILINHKALGDIPLEEIEQHLSLVESHPEAYAIDVLTIHALINKIKEQANLLNTRK